MIDAIRKAVATVFACLGMLCSKAYIKTYPGDFGDILEEQFEPIEVDDIREADTMEGGESFEDFLEMLEDLADEEDDT